MRCTCSATSRPIPTGSTHERGEAHYRQALALAEPRGMRPLVAHCHLGLGKLYRRTGKREQAQEHRRDGDDDVPRDGHDVLAGAGGGEAVAITVRLLRSQPSCRSRLFL